MTTTKELETAMNDLWNAIKNKPQGVIVEGSETFQKFVVPITPIVSSPPLEEDFYIDGIKYRREIDW